MKKFFTFLLISTFVLVQAQKTKNSNQTIKVSYSKSYNGKLQENQDNIWIFSNSNETLITSENTILQKSNFPYEQTLVKRDKNALLQITQLKKNASTSTLDSISLGKQSFEFSDETKKILGYTCYKAIRKTIAPRMTMRTMSMGGPNSEETVKSNSPASAPKEIETVAWYTNDIITPAGPENYGLLPGLILEIDVDNGTTVFKATEVKASLNKKELKEPTKGKIIGRKEFQKLQMDMMQQEMPGMMQMRRGNN
mgnify:CR=1 FL=1